MTLEELYRLLRSSHVQSQGIVDTLAEPLIVLDRGFTVINANPAFYRVFHTERDDTIGHGLFELGDGQWDIAELRTLLLNVVPRSAAVVGFEVTHDFPGIGERTMHISARQLAHPDSTSTQMLVVFEDMTERHKADLAKDILLAETRHRMKNLLAMVRALAHQTDARGRTAEEYRDIFMGRFEALLQAQEYIAATGSDADLATLIGQAVKPVAGARAVLSPGPAVRLNQYQVMPLSMVLHELATNAVKYGALSTTDGSIRIGWSTQQRDGQTHLQLDWREQGGPPVVKPQRRGFGSELIDYSMRGEGGDAVFDYDPAGVRVTMTMLVGS